MRPDENPRGHDAKDEHRRELFMAAKLGLAAAAVIVIITLIALWS